MSKDPAILFYYKDFDSDTADWEADAIGWYVRLLIFQSGNGYVPSDIEGLAQVARVRFSDYQLFCDRWARRLACKFEAHSEGKLYNKFLSEVQLKRKSGAIKKSVLAVFGNFIKSTELSLKEEKELKILFHKDTSFYDVLDAEKRKEDIILFLNNSLIKIKQRIAKPKRTQQGNEIGNVNEDITENTTITLWPDFEDFWDEYDKKIGSRSKIEPKWEILSQKTKEEIMAYIPNYKISQPEKKFRKNPETFFNNESWKDEIISSNGNKSQNNGQSNGTDFNKVLSGIDAMYGDK